MPLLRHLTVAAAAAAALSSPAVTAQASPGTPPPPPPGASATVRAAAAARSAAAARAAMPAWFRGPQLRGIDVSAWQPVVAWNWWSGVGRSFAWVKATEGTTWRSSTFAQQYRGAADAGWARGAYHFARPNRSSGAAQAAYFVRYGGAWKKDGQALPGALDMEMPPSGDECYGLTPSAMVSWISSFTTRYKKATGRYPIIYTSDYWWRTCTGNTSTFSSTSRLWLARYAATPGRIPGGWTRPDVWQTGEINGMDHNVWFGTAASLRDYASGRRP